MNMRQEKLISTTQVRYESEDIKLHQMSRSLTTQKFASSYNGIVQVIMLSRKMYDSEAPLCVMMKRGCKAQNSIMNTFAQYFRD